MESPFKIQISIFWINEKNNIHAQSLGYIRKKDYKELVNGGKDTQITFGVKNLYLERILWMLKNLPKEQ